MDIPRPVLTTSLPCQTMATIGPELISGCQSHPTIYVHLTSLIISYQDVKKSYPGKNGFEERSLSTKSTGVFEETRTMLFQMFLGSMDHLHRNELESTIRTISRWMIIPSFLKSANDFSNQSSHNTIRLDSNKSLFSRHFWWLWVFWLWIEDFCDLECFSNSDESEEECCESNELFVHTQDVQKFHWVHVYI